MRALVTGATGFIGRALVAELLARGHAVRAAVRRPEDCLAGAETVVLGDLSAATDWRATLRGIDTVFHLAALVHTRGTRHDEAEWERINVASSVALAIAARDAGACRYVFISSVKVMGETSGARPFVESDAPQPQDAYGRSKLAAEQALTALGGDLAITIVRPPLVYGPGVRANFLSLLRLADSRWPLPLANATAGRSLIFVGNLVDALIACATTPHSTPATYFVADRDDRSVAELVTLLRAALGRRARLWPMPAAIARALAATLGRRDAAQRLFAPLQVSSDLIRRQLGWSPPCDQRTALESTARWYRRAREQAA